MWLLRRRQTGDGERDIEREGGREREGEREGERERGRERERARARVGVCALEGQNGGGKGHHI